MKLGLGREWGAAGRAGYLWILVCFARGNVFISCLVVAFVITVGPSGAKVQGWRTYWGPVPKVFINLRVCGNFEEENKVLKSLTQLLLIIALLSSLMSIKLIAYCNYYISNKDLLKEFSKEENLGVNGAVTASYLKRRLQNILSNVTYSPSHHQTGAPTINIQSTFRTASDLCKNVSLQCYFLATAVHIQSVRCQTCVHVLHNIG
jgi:hypothetical protein